VTPVRDVELGLAGAPGVADTILCWIGSRVATRPVARQGALSRGFALVGLSRLCPADEDGHGIALEADARWLRCCWRS
jgi:hypothetical protein